MNCLAEVIGLALPGNGTIPAARWIDKSKGTWEVNPDRIGLIEKVGKRIKYLMENNICPLDIVTRESIDNAFILDLAMGGSTNTVLHTIALAREQVWITRLRGSMSYLELHQMFVRFPPLDQKFI
jgi:dihydroxy-acid dehydratase